MKSHMTNIDICYMLYEFQKYVNHRVDNIYEINNKQYVIKLIDNDKHKSFIKLNSGHYFYSMNGKPENCINIPNSFCMKLRKHINNKKCLQIKQLGIDRIIILSFGFDIILYHIIIEFYADGNIILCDENYKIIANLRNYKNDTINIKVGNIYPVDIFNTPIDSNLLNYDTFYQYYLQYKKDNLDLYQIYKEHLIIKKIGLTLFKHYCIQSNNDIQLLHHNIMNYNYEFDISKHPNYENSGYLIYDNSNNIIDIVPFMYSFYQNYQSKKINSLSLAYHNYFNTITTNNHSKIKQNKKNKDKNKIDNINRSNLKKIKQLETKINNINLSIQWIYDNITSLNKLLSMININKKINNIEYLNHHYIPSYFDKIKIEKIDYHNYTLTIKIIDLDNTIDINYQLSTYLNINQLYQLQKKIIYKKDKTMIENEKVIKKMKQKIDIFNSNLDNNTITIHYKYKSIKFWFQQFNWTITSNKLLFICGKNISQNEMIVKKYLNNKCHYLHGDFNGSPSGILFYYHQNDKNNELYLKDKIECNDFLLSHTKLWKEKISNKCYYVDNKQVTKQAPSGEYINNGSFMIYGKKNYLPLSQQELGIGLLFIKEIEDNNNNVNNNDNINTDIKQNEITQILNRFIENPTITDNIIYCIPILSSYKSLLNYKYKIKLIPGNHKKGKNVKIVQNYFNKLSVKYPKEHFLIKKIDKNILDNIMLSNSQLVLSYKNK